MTDIGEDVQQRPSNAVRLSAAKRSNPMPLDDDVALDQGVSPDDVTRSLIEAVNLGWRAGGNDGRCNVPANFVGWLLQENERLRLAGEAIDRRSLVIESAVRNADPEHHGFVVKGLLALRAALSSSRSNSDG
jgi:hypothetical protein